MRYLIDTNVISALAPGRVDRTSILVDWMDRASAEICLSVVTAAEIRDGICKLTREGASRKAANLALWWNAVEHLYDARILSFDLGTARLAGALSDKARSLGFAPGFADIAIAATADQHGLVLLTRNTRHFRPIGIAVIDPFEHLPALSDSPP